MSFVSAEVRTQIIREAREKSITIPSYLQYPLCFDLKSEYNKWHKHHPEYPYITPITMSNICSSLGLNNSPSPNKHNVSSLSLVPNRKCIEEAAILAQILSTLIYKSQPIETHEDILSHPIDLKSDMMCFLNDNSCVVFLSNLPHDITHNELETWFFHHGLQPTELWTLRTPELFKPLGYGFALFNTHEEAIDSLNLNGNSLNDRIIEVLPSIYGVLDKAADIITHFPQTKNRPRPGDWNCPSCGFSNFQRRTACFRCSFPLPGSAFQNTHQNTGYNNNMANGFNFKSNMGNISKSPHHSLSDITVQNASLESFQSQTNENPKTKLDGYQRYKFDPEEEQASMIQSEYMDMNPSSPVKYDSRHRLSYGNEGSSPYTNESAQTSQHSFHNSLNMNVLQNRSVGSFTKPADGMNEQRKSTSSLAGGNYNPNNSKGNYNGTPGNSSNVIPFRAGDWRCGVQGCDYHNFAKNVNCLKCGASRISASVLIADANHDRNQNSKNSFNNNYQGQPKTSRHQNQGYNVTNQRYRALPKKHSTTHRDGDNHGNNRNSSGGSMNWSQGSQPNGFSGQPNDKGGFHSQTFKYQPSNNHQYDEASRNYEEIRDGRTTTIKKANSLHVQKHRNLQRQASLPSQQYHRMQRQFSNQNFSNHGQSKSLHSHNHTQSSESLDENPDSMPFKQM